MLEAHLLVTVGLGALFLAAAFTKIASPASFRAAVLAYGVVPRQLVRPVAWLVPAVEFCVAALLLSGWAVPVALIAAAALLMLFCAAMVLTMRSGRRPDCGCGVGAPKPVSVGLIVRNLVLASLAVLASDDPPAGLRAVFTGAGQFSDGGGVTALLTLVVLVIGVRIVSEGRRTLTGVRIAQGGGRR